MYDNWKNKQCMSHQTSKNRSILGRREKFWILRLGIPSPKGLNISLNHPQDTTGS